MHGFTFTVDRNLIIRSIDIGTGKGDTGALFAAGMIGQPYQRFFPLFLEGEVDAVEKVLREEAPLFLRAHQMICFCGSIHADICITPLLDADDSVVGAEITREVVSGCDMPDTMWRERQLIDIGRNSAALAHGVRNPLNAIKGAVVYLKNTFGKEPTVVEFAGIIEEEISKLDGFITKFLSTSLLESEFEPLDVNQLLRRILAASSFQACVKKISFHPDLGDVPIIRADDFQLGHAVMNIINNAMEAMVEGGSIRLKTGTIFRDGRDFVFIEISDSGGGINRVDSSGVSDSPGGTDGRGFGLFLTREIVRHHGGLLEIVSRKNHGTSVGIFLPVSSA
jgi:two-component system nitrogen regulation sensor histidine kinase GlnL